MGFRTLIVFLALLWTAQCDVTGVLNAEGNNFMVSNMTENDVLSIVYNLRNAPPDNNWNMMRGYHLFLGNPNTPNTQIDPGFLRTIWSAGISSKGFNFFPTSTCSLDFSSTTIASTAEYQQDLEVTAEVKGGFGGFLATASMGFKSAQESFESEKSVVVKSEAMCSVSQEFLTMSDPPELSSMFEASVRNTDFKDPDSIMENLFDEYGTHFPTQMLTGSRFVIESKVTDNSYRDMVSQGIDVNMAASYSGLFSVGASAGMKYATSTAKTFDKTRESKKVLSYGARPEGDGDSMSWAADADFSPLPIRYKLDSLDNMFTDTVFGPYGFSSEEVTEMREAVLSALNEYCEARMVEWGMFACEPYNASESNSMSLITSTNAVEEAIQLYKITQVKSTWKQSTSGATSFFTIFSASESNPFYLLSDSYSDNPYESTIYAVSSPQVFAFIAPSAFNQVASFAIIKFSELACADGYSPVGVIANAQDSLLKFYRCVNDNYLTRGIAGSVISNGNIAGLTPSIKKRSQPRVDMNIPYISTSSFHYIQEKYLKKTILNIESYSVAVPTTVSQLQVLGIDSNKPSGANYLIDGDNSCSTTSKCYTQYGGWIALDLGKVFRISKIVAAQPCSTSYDYKGQLFYGTIDKEFSSVHNLFGGWGFNQRAPNSIYEVQGNNNRARYIVQRASGTRNALCEIKVYGSPDTKEPEFGNGGQTTTEEVVDKTPVLLKPTTCNSNSKYNNDAGCEKVYDGKSSAAWGDKTCFHTAAKSSSNWASYDLGATKTVLTVETLSRSDCCPERTLVNIQVCETSDGSKCKPCGKRANREMNKWSTVTCAAGATGRYVRITPTAYEHLQICEIRIKGYDPSKTTSVVAPQVTVEVTSTETQFVCEKWEWGDGKGTETYLGQAEGMTWCVNLVKKMDPKANGATMQKPAEGGPYKCYKEVGQTSVASSGDWLNCIIGTKTWKFSAISPRVPWQAAKKLALRQATSSGEYTSGSQLLKASNAIDGDDGGGNDLDTMYHSKVGSVGQYIQVSFDRSEVTMVRIRNRNSNAGRLEKCDLQICDNGNCKKFATVVYGEDSWLDYACPSVVGNAFKILQTKNDYINIMEIEVYGAPVNANAPKYIMPSSSSSSSTLKSWTPASDTYSGLMSDFGYADAFLGNKRADVFIDVNFVKSDVIFIELTGRSDCCYDRMEGMKFEICDGLNCSPCGYFATFPTPNTWNRVQCPEPLTGDRLRITNPSRQHLEISELRIAGWKL